MFKDLARKGHVIELAAAIVLAQFAANLLSQFVVNVVEPPLGFLLGGRSLASLFWNLTPNKTTPQGGPIDSIEKAYYAGACVIGYGALLHYLLTFLVVLFATIILLRWLKKTNANLGTSTEPDI